MRLAGRGRTSKGHRRNKGHHAERFSAADIAGTYRKTKRLLKGDSPSKNIYTFPNRPTRALFRAYVQNEKILFYFFYRLFADGKPRTIPGFFSLLCVTDRAKKKRPHLESNVQGIKAVDR